jgi:hypothetical protein
MRAVVFVRVHTPFTPQAKDSHLVQLPHLFTDPLIEDLTSSSSPQDAQAKAVPGRPRRSRFGTALGAQCVCAPLI